MAAKKDLDDLVTCSVCMENYSDPRTLPCTHSFCLGCLEKLLANGRKTIECPVCREKTSVPEGGPSHYKVNFTLNSLKDVMRRTKTEDGEYQFYCEDCEELLTYESAATRHNGHRYRKIQGAYTDHLTVLRESLSHLQKRTKEVASHQEVLQKVEFEISKQKDEIKEHITRFSESLIDSIRKATTEKLNQVDEIFDRKIQIASEQRQESDKVLEGLIGTQGQVERKLHDNTQCQLLSEKQEISQEIHTAVSNSKLDFKPKEKADVVFIGNSSLAHSCPKLGYLTLDDKQTYSFRHDGVVMAGTPSTVTLFVSPSQCRGPPFDPPPPIKCTLTSCNTGTTTLCNIGRRCNSSYTFEITPIDWGKQELSIAADDIGQTFSTFMIAHPSPFMRGIPLKVLKSLKKPTGITITSKGMLIVVNQGSSTHNIVCIADPSGESPRYICKHVTSTDPHGIALTDNEECIVITEKHRVKLVSLKGSVIASIGGAKKGNKSCQFYNPMGVAIHPETKQFYVADSGNHRIVILDEKNLRWVSEFGKKGHSLGAFDEPADIAFNSGKMYIVNHGSSCIDVYSANDHKPLFRMGTGPGLLPRNEDLSCPSSLAIDSFGYVYVTEVSAPLFSTKRFMNSRISVYQIDGTLVRSFGSKGKIHGCFDNPCGITINHEDGSLYVCDTDNDRVVIL